MTRKMHIAGKGPDDCIRIADASGKVVCTLPRTEQRLSRFIVRCVNWFGFGLRPYDKHDWWMEKNPEHGPKYRVRGGYSAPGDGTSRPQLPTTGSGVQRA